MRNASRLSRINFIAASGAFLAACSARGTVLPGAAPPGSRDIAAARRAVSNLGYSGYQLSTSTSRHAVALHTSAGQFVWSCAIGTHFTRHTYADGTQVVFARAVPRKKGWHHLEGGGTFRYKRSKSGSVGICSVSDDRRQKIFLYTSGEDTLVLRYPAKGIETLQLRSPALPPSATAADKLESITDNLGTWALDDDFVGAVGQYAPNAGYVKKQERKKQPKWRGRHPEQVRATQFIASYDPGSDPYSGAGDPGPTDLTDPVPADFSDPYDLGTAGDPYDVLDTYPYDQPTDDVASETCMEDLHDAKTTAEAVAKATSTQNAACAGLGRKSVARSTMAAKRKPPIRKPPISAACIRADVDLTGAIAKAAAAAKKANDDGCYATNA